jgi:ABC-type dipeptide/oligopeptide/nickel transport system permease component
VSTYIARRLIQAFFILIGLSLIFFVIVHLTPGGPCAAEGAGVKGLAGMQACQRRLGLDKPLVVQYFNQMGVICTEISEPASPETPS